MSGYSVADIDAVRAGNDIVVIISPYVRLEQRGGEHVGLCPFHKEKSPSFKVSQSMQIYKCFGCGEGGDVFTFLMKAEGYDFPEAVRALAQRIGYPLPEATGESPGSSNNALRDIHKAAARYFFGCLHAPSGTPAKKYLQERGMDTRTIRRFGLGYDPGSVPALLSHLEAAGFSKADTLSAGLVVEKGSIYCRFARRLIFPIFDISGGVIGFGGRALEEGASKRAKYLNSQESPVFSKSRILYALNYARKSKSDEYILAEGYMDVISLHQYGFDNSIAALGTAFTEGHAKLVAARVKKVVLAFDGDSAGQKAALGAIGLLAPLGVRVRVLSLEHAKDPDEFLKKFGAQALKDALAKAEPQVMYRVRLLHGQFDTSQAEGRIGFARAAADILAGIQERTERDVYISEIAKKFDISPMSLAQDVEARSHMYALGAGAPDTRRGQAPGHGARSWRAPASAQGGTNTEDLPDIIEEHRRALAYLLQKHPELVKPLLAGVPLGPLQEVSKPPGVLPTTSSDEEIQKFVSDSVIRLEQHRIDSEIAAIKQALEANPTDENFKKLVQLKTQRRNTSINLETTVY